MVEVYVEANIGTGKTTFLNWLKDEFPHFNYILEPVEQWTSLEDKKGQNILDHFYKDQNKWAFTFQMNSFISRIQKIKKKTVSNTVNFIERSVFTDKNCFAKNCYDNKKINDIEYEIYNNWHNWLCDQMDISCKAFIYLKTTPEISSKRIKKRNRDEECNIPIKYLEDLHNLHEDWMLSEIEKNTKVLILDVSNNFYEDEEQKKQILEKVIEFVKSI